jgi:hypothetical protein
MTQCVAGFGDAGVGFEQTFMGGVASHFPIAFEAVFIDRQSHSHHVSGDLFGFLLSAASSRSDAAPGPWFAL